MTYIFYLMYDTWYLLNSSWVHLLLIHHKYYTKPVKTNVTISTIMNTAVNFVELLKYTCKLKATINNL